MERVAYVLSKHIYWLPDDPNHYFRFQETIVIVLIAVKLGGGLKKRSRYVRNCAKIWFFLLRNHLLVTGKELTEMDCLLILRENCSNPVGLVSVSCATYLKNRGTLQVHL
jgi:hypothetical protein